MLSKLLGSSVVVIGLLLAGPQRASADVVYACVNTTTGLLYVVGATTNCPPPTSGATWIKINWTANAGGQASNVLYTPAMNVPPPNLGSCNFVNVSAQARTIHAEQFHSNGTLRDQLTSTLQPGHATGFGNATADLFYCKFTVTDGTSSDIRGSLDICTNAACGLYGIAAQ